MTHDSLRALDEPSRHDVRVGDFDPTRSTRLCMLSSIERAREAAATSDSRDSGSSPSATRERRDRVTLSAQALALARIPEDSARIGREPSQAADERRLHEQGVRTWFGDAKSP